MKTKLLALFIAVAFLFAGCSNVESSDLLSDVDSTLITTQINELSDDNSTVSQINEEQSNVKTTQTHSTSASVSPETQKSDNSIDNIGNSSEFVQNETVNNKTQTVTVSVDCKNAINYGILSVGSFSQVLSADGIILTATQTQISEGESVMSVLKRTLKENHITYSITSSGYVRTINGLSEFDCGETSGWLYKVDGVLPSVSCKSYKLYGGEKIEFVYTCVKGDV